MMPTHRPSSRIRVILLVLVLVGLAILAFATSNATNKRTSSNTFAGTSTQVTLTVNASQQIATFPDEMRGVGLATWEYAWDKPLPNAPSLQKVNAAFKKIKPGYIRYAGGNWINNTGWDRRARVNPGSYNVGQNNYYHLFTPTEIDAVAGMANAIGTDVMIEVNLIDNDPTMWADLVTYAKTNNYPFKYWELGNENEANWNWDPNTGRDDRLAPDTYLQRAAAYEAAMKTANSNIVVIGNGAATPNKSQPYQDSYDSEAITRQIGDLPAYNRSRNGREIGGVSWHWYLSYQDETMRTLFRYNVPNSNASVLEGNEGGRIWPDLAAKKVEQTVVAGRPILQAITEVNTLADNRNHIQQNHVAAMFLSDAIPRFAANGVDMASVWLGYSQFGSSFGMIQHDGYASNLRLNSTYYTYFMLANYFGDQLLYSTSSNMDGMSVWASRDTTDPGKIKLMITNFTDTDLTGTLAMQNFIPQTGVYYELLPDRSLGSLDGSGEQDVYSNLNGVKLDINNLDSSIAQIQPRSLTIAGTGFTRTFPKYSVTSVILTGTGGGVTVIPTTAPTATPTLAPGQPTYTPTPTVTPYPTTAPPTPTPLGPTPTGIVKPIADKFATIAKPTPLAVTPGETVNLGVEVTARDAGTYLVDIEVYNANGTQIGQWFTDNQSFTAQQTRTYAQNWTVPTSLPIGTYTVKVGVFATGWSTMHHWNNAAGYVTVRVNAPAATATPTTAAATPTATKTPTPTVQQASPTATKTPTITPTRTPTPVASQAPSATSAPQPTNTSIPTAVPTGSCPKKSLGDANCDGKINIMDFQWWVNEFTERITTRNADFDGQSTCTKADGSAKYTCPQDKEIWRQNFLK